MAAVTPWHARPCRALQSGLFRQHACLLRAAPAHSHEGYAAKKHGHQHPAHRGHCRAQGDAEPDGLLRIAGDGYAAARAAKADRTRNRSAQRQHRDDARSRPQTTRPKREFAAWPAPPTPARRPPRPAAAVVVLHHETWQAPFGGRPVATERMPEKYPPRQGRSIPSVPSSVSQRPLTGTGIVIVLEYGPWQESPSRPGEKHERF